MAFTIGRLYAATSSAKKSDAPPCMSNTVQQITSAFQCERADATMSAQSESQHALAHLPLAARLFQPAGIANADEARMCRDR